MRKSIIVATALLMLAGCTQQPTTLQKEIYLAVSPPANLFDCPDVREIKLIDPAKATNKEVAVFIEQLYTVGRKCKISETKIKQWIKTAEALVAEKNKDSGNNR